MVVDCSSEGIRPGLIRADLVALVTDSPELGEIEDIANLAMSLLSDVAS